MKYEKLENLVIPLLHFVENLIVDSGVQMVIGKGRFTICFMVNAEASSLYAYNVSAPYGVVRKV